MHKKAAHPKVDSQNHFLEPNDAVIHCQGLAVCGKGLVDMISDHNKLPPIKSGRKTVPLIVPRMMVLKVPAAAFHLQNLAVLNQHLGEVLLDRMLLGHSQIPPFYVGRITRREISFCITCKGSKNAFPLKCDYYSILTRREKVV